VEVVVISLLSSFLFQILPLFPFACELSIIPLTRTAGLSPWQITHSVPEVWA